MCIYSWMGGKLTMLTELTNITAQLEPNAGTTTRVPGLQIFSHSLCVGATRDCEMSETWRGSYVYNSLGAAARHIQQHFPSVYLCTYNIVSLLWASHSCYSSIHLLTHFAVFSLCSPLCAGLCFCHFSRSLSLSSLSRLFSVCLLIFFLICCLFLSVSATYFLCSLFVGLFSLSHFESQGSVASLWKTGRYSVVTQFVPVCFPLSPAAFLLILTQPTSSRASHHKHMHAHGGIRANLHKEHCIYYFPLDLLLYFTRTPPPALPSFIMFCMCDAPGVSLNSIAWLLDQNHSLPSLPKKKKEKKKNSFADPEHNFPEMIHIWNADEEGCKKWSWLSLSTSATLLLFVYRP